MIKCLIFNNYWSKNDLLRGKYIGNFFYSSPPKKRYSLIWRQKNFNNSYGFFLNSYNSIRAAEQAILSYNLIRRFTLVDEITKEHSHYIIHNDYFKNK